MKNIFHSVDLQVIFSQSSDLVERQSSVASSTEEVSGPDLSASSGQNPDHFGVFKDFDFLEYESESVEGESTDNFNWGVRRRPISEGEAEAEGDPSLRTQEESLSEKTPILSSRKRVGCGGPEESSDDEVGSESPLDDMTGAPEFNINCASADPDTLEAASCGGLPPSSLDLSQRRGSNTSGSSGTAGDLGDVTPCNTSPNLSGMMSLAFQPIARDDAEEVWRAQLLSLFSSSPSPSHSHLPSSTPLHHFHVLRRIVKDVVRKSVCVTREACHWLGEAAGNQDERATATQLELVAQLANLTDTLATHSSPPLVYFSPASRLLASPSRLQDALRFGMLELREHLDTFIEKKEHTAECMDTVKREGREQERESNANSSRPTLEDAALDLGRACYKLHFQLLLLLESANKMFTVLCTTAHENQLQDVSEEIVAMRAALSRAQDESVESSDDQATPTPSPLTIPTTTTTTPPHPALPSSSSSDVALIELLQDGQWLAALNFVRRNRRSWPSDVILTGAEEDDITGILSVYCSHLIKEKQDVFVVTEQDLGVLLSSLMKGLYQVMAALNKFQSRLHHGESSAPTTPHS